jgi:hypothetical protein
MTDLAATAFAEAARTLQEAVREHKRAASHHRRQAQTLMGRLAELRRECDRLGITLVEITAPKGGRDSDGRSS